MRLSALALVIVVLATCLSSCKPKLKNIDPKTVRGTVSPLNCASCERDLYLCDDTLFAYISQTLYKINNNGTFRKIFYTSSVSTGFFLGNGFFYYMLNQASNQEDHENNWSLKRYDLKTGITENVLLETEKPDYFLSRGDAVVFINFLDKIYGSVTEKENNVDIVVEKGIYNEEITVGKRKAMLEYDGHTSMAIITEDGRKEMILNTDPCAVLQISNDKLLVSRISPQRVHIFTKDSLALAWVVDSEGELHELINPEGYAYFAGNYCNGYYYCSFYRYKEEHKFNSEKFENDKLEGTWKVNVETFEQTKISDKIYDDIFVIGDKVIGVDSSRTFSIINKG